MTIVELQQKIDEWIKKYGVRYFNELTNMALLTEEVGEFARIITRTYGEQSAKVIDKKYSLANEMGDVLFVLTCMANKTGVDLTRAIEENLNKKTKRDYRRHKENNKFK